MHLFKKFFSSFNKITFKNPKKSSILIFDQADSDIIIRSILQDIDYSILPIRNEILYLSPAILFKMIKKINIFDLIEPKKLLTNIVFNYFFCCVEYINPRIVLTLTDNNGIFHQISKIFDKAEFYAIQNGHRAKMCVYYSVLNSDNTIRQKSIKNFVCFGQSDVDNFLRYGHIIETAHCVGSLKGSYYKHLFKNKKEKNKYSICFVSQREDTPYFYRCNQVSIWQEMEETFYNLLNWYLEKYHSSACIACRSSTKEEYNFFLEKFGDKATIIPAKLTNGLSSTYEVMDSSEVIIAINTTAAYEAVGWGKKVFFCFFLDDEKDPYYKDGRFSMRKPDPIEFENKLNALLNMNQEDYERITEKERKYLMNYNPDVPVHIYMRNIIEKTLNA